MKLEIMNIDGKAGGQKQLPQQFDEPVRTDLIKRAVLSLQSRSRQAYGADPEAGDKQAVDISRRRRDYKGSYGKGISRVPRKTMSRRGGQFNWQAARAPGVKGGRRAHPPKAEKIWTRKINEKENRKAIRSALAATIDKELVSKRGHKTPDNYPFIVSDSLADIKRTSELVSALEKLGFNAELARANNRQTRPGVGKLRGRVNKKKSLLIVIADKAPVLKAATNVTGMDAVTAQELNAELLAPGARAGRVTLYTESALKAMEEKKLFL
jgi:large subunit ribosomal protein L4e